MERITLGDAADYQVGWISALSLETAAAIAILDEQHDPPRNFTQNNQDSNSYSFGRIGEHNIVIATLPAGQYGLVSATRTSLGLIASFPHLRLGLLVGIGAAIPESPVDVRLGDVVVSQPEGNNGGVIQYDLKKATKSGGWELIGALTRPPAALLTALSQLQAKHYLEESRVISILQDVSQKHPKFASTFKYPGLEHHDEADTIRPKKATSQPHIHYGTIASGNTLIKNTSVRREIFASVAKSCICFEMEAAGLQNDFPCLVIRGICDYADENKNDHWQPYASATAAAFAKELLMYLSRKELDKTRGISEVIKPLKGDLEFIKQNLADTRQYNEDEKASALLPHRKMTREDRWWKSFRDTTLYLFISMQGCLRNS